jgi:hypothetical protein
VQGEQQRGHRARGGGRLRSRDHPETSYQVIPLVAKTPSPPCSAAPCSSSSCVAWSRTRARGGVGCSNGPGGGKRASARPAAKGKDNSINEKWFPHRDRNVPLTVQYVPDVNVVRLFDVEDLVEIAFQRPGSQARRFGSCAYAASQRLGGGQCGCKPDRRGSMRGCVGSQRVFESAQANRGHSGAREVRTTDALEAENEKGCMRRCPRLWSNSR